MMIILEIDPSHMLIALLKIRGSEVQCQRQQVIIQLGNIRNHMLLLESCLFQMAQLKYSPGVYQQMYANFSVRYVNKFGIFFPSRS